jgi:hypothetical protein
MQNINLIVSEPYPKTHINPREFLKSTSSDIDMVLINGKIYSLIPLTAKALQNESTELKVSEYRKESNYAHWDRNG